MLRKDFLLHPPGACDADGSGRGEKQDQARHSRIPVEDGTELIEIADPLEFTGGLRLDLPEQLSGRVYGR